MRIQLPVCTIVPKEPKKMAIKCLMLETSDNRRFFTSLGMRKALRDCCRAFNVKIHVVRADLKRSDLMNVQKLASALCDKTDNSKDTKFELADGRKRP